MKEYYAINSKEIRGVYDTEKKLSIRLSNFLYNRNNEKCSGGLSFLDYFGTSYDPFNREEIYLILRKDGERFFEIYTNTEICNEKDLFESEGIVCDDVKLLSNKITKSDEEEILGYWIKDNEKKVKDMTDFFDSLKGIFGKNRTDISETQKSFENTVIQYKKIRK